MSLPIPKNTDGCDAYEDAMDILEYINKDIPISNESNKIIIKKAIKVASQVDEDIDKDDLAKNESLLALLYFISNNYKKAKTHAQKSINLSKEINTKYTLPAFIFATSSLYDKTFDFNHITNKYFKYSIVNEADNPIIPLLFSIYLDRMMYRFNDNYLKPSALDEVFTVASNEALNDKKIQNYIIILSRYIIRLKLEQQKISSLATTSNETIKNSSKTLKVVQESLKNYDSLVSGAKIIINEFLKLEIDKDDQKSLEKILSLSRLVYNYKNDNK